MTNPLQARDEPQRRRTPAIGDAQPPSQKLRRAVSSAQYLSKRLFPAPRRESSLSPRSGCHRRRLPWACPGERYKLILAL